MADREPAKIVVIADDLSGAAELAGIANLHGLTAEVQTVWEPASDAQVIAVDTDSRGLPAEAAVACVFDLAQAVSTARPQMIFKKVDSVLRGNVRVEIEAILAATSLRQAVLAPANPSRGRVIYAGQYRIAGVPLDETEFSNDPEHPRLTANIAALLGESAPGIFIPDVSSSDDLDRLARSLGDDALPAGAADFFAAVLRQRGLSCASASMDEPRLAAPAVLVCGSLAAWSAREAECRRAGVPVVSLDSVGDGGLETSAEKMKSGGALVVIPGEVETSPAGRSQQFDRFTAAAAELFRKSQVATVLAEGGATAAAIARRLGWSRLATIAAAPAGVGVLRPLSAAVAPVLLIKPGSYTWPEAIWGQFVRLR